MTLAAGTKLGRYEIRSRIGEGGMGEVYLAEDTRLGRKVALKRLPDDLLTDEQARRRFAQEAKTASALIYRGPNTPLMGGDIWVMPALGGSGARRIAEAGNFPSWSPDGSAIIYEGGPWGDPKIFSIPASGGKPREIPVKLKAGEPPLTFLFYPSYSSDRRWIVFEAQQETIYLVSAAGGEAQRIVRGKRPVWNADSSAIIYSSADPGRNFSLQPGRHLEP